MPEALVYVNSWPGVDKEAIANAVASRLESSSSSNTLPPQSRAQVWANTQVDRSVEAQLTASAHPNGASTSPMDLRRQVREEFLREVASERNHDIHIFTDFQTSEPLDATNAEMYRSVALDADCRFIPVILNGEPAEQEYRRSLRSEADETAEGQPGARLYSFGVPLEFEMDIGLIDTEAAAEAIANHIREVFGGPSEVTLDDQ